MMNNSGIGDESGGGGGEPGGVAQQTGSPEHLSLGQGRRGSSAGRDQGPLPTLCFGGLVLVLFFHMVKYP